MYYIPKIMESNIFGLQCEFMDKWDQLYNEQFVGEPKNKRLCFFKKLNIDMSNFYHMYIDHNIWNFQRAYFFAFWLGIYYIKNADCFLEIEKIINFSNIYNSFVKIKGMLNSKVKRIIIDSKSEESEIIFKKMNKFKFEQILFEQNINKILRYYRKYMRKKMIKKYCTAISVIRRRLPDDIIIIIAKYFESNNDIIINYLLNKDDLDMILKYSGLSKKSLTFVLEKYLKNKKNVVNTINDIIEYLSCTVHE